ncbi:ATP-binding protein [Chitinophaga filiformis]|uniref:tetratricopeptide repeat-containing sensor histidine kinase n=1 Tax=Chitinophaga filiformis TaxID=104663 RepID=UPI001F488A1C|nr:histidine kinase dimerization/phosphoacceptor domain -containing protein [Chitinophaga filiformis]MCF6404593.1 ATP-binding protein [Chitinophaga filiformis]
MEQMFESSTDSLKAEIARNISRYYNDGRFEPKNFQKARDYALASLDISVDMNDRERQINANNQLAFVYLMEDKIDESERHFLQVINLGKQLRSENVGFAYYNMMRLTTQKGYYNRAIQYGLDALRYLERPGYDPYSMDIYIALGNLYSVLGEYDKSLELIDLALKEAEQKSDFDYYWYFLNYRTNTMLNMDRAKDALPIIQEALFRHPPESAYSRAWAALIQGKIYVSLKEYGPAKISLLQALELSRDSTISNARQKVFRNGSYKSMADTYFAVGDWKTAGEYIDKLLQPSAFSTAGGIADVHLLAFKIDSARGDFQSAMLHLQKNKSITDSLNALSRFRQIEELQLQYKTEKIMQDVKLKQQTILLLENRQALQFKEYEESRLKFLIESKDKENSLLTLSAEAAEKDKNILLSKQSIMQLQADNASRKARLESANFTRNITFGFVFLLALIVVLLYRQFRSKQAATKIIGKKNEVLQHLVQEKEGLLEEKDWLLKEVHHRVKNNLQTVVSLLESQSVYLDNKALQANQDSRNRVYAMSLVHQKLYQSENIASIQIDTYLKELVEHLREGIGNENIYFKLQLSPVKLDVSQAIPLGLILNEAITNAIKHAFPDSATDRIISVNLQMDEAGRLCLTIQDNGIGFPENIANGNPFSLGLKLMKGLTGDIMGDFAIRSENGTMITINFLPVETLHMANKMIR